MKSRTNILCIMENDNKKELSLDKNKKIKRGATRHCCYGLCRSDSRYKDRDFMENVSCIVFQKPHRDREKCKKWVHACGRANFTSEKVNKWTDICNKHFVDGNGPTEEFPDPIPASFTPIQTEKYSRQRKPPTSRANPVSKKALLEASEALLSLQDAVAPSAGDQLNVTEQTAEQEPEPSTTDEPTNDFGVNTEPVQTNDKGSQTMYACNEKLAMKIDNVQRCPLKRRSFRSSVLKKPLNIRRNSSSTLY